MDRLHLREFCGSESKILRFFWMLNLAKNWMIVLFSMILPPCPQKNWILRRTGCDIHPTAWISPLVFIDPVCPKMIHIGPNVVVGFFARIVAHYIAPRSEAHPLITTSWEGSKSGGMVKQVILDDLSVYLLQKKQVVISPRSFVGAESTIQPGSFIGKKVIIGERSLVKINTVCDDGIWLGIPAKKMR